MAAVRPTQVFANYVALANGAAAPADGIFIPLASLSGLSAAEADESTGNADSVLFALIKTATTNYNSLAITAKSQRMALARNVPSATVNSDADKVYSTFQQTFTLDISNVDVADEPS